MPKYLLPAGRDGFIYKDEVRAVLEKYRKLKVSLQDDAAIDIISQEITKAIQSLPLNCVEVEEDAQKYIERLKI